jgi:hypothetical protein
MRTIVLVLVAITGLAAEHENREQALAHWKVHDVNRPVPPVISPAAPGRAPSDATVLFDGRDLSKWQSAKGGAAQWKVVDGAMEVVPGTGETRTVQSFGDCQLHLEWAEPNPPHDKDQGRGNSGVYLMSRYELQVLDSYQNKTYADGQAGAIYGQFPPLVNASLPPGQWQTYDIVFHGPRFSSDGKLLRPARATVLQNGVLVQDNVELTGPTDHGRRPPYSPHAEKMPLLLQDHDQPVRFRNIWIRELPE